MDKTLMSISKEFDALIEKIALNGGEIGAEDGDIIKELETFLLEKTDSVAKYIENEEMGIDILTNFLADLRDERRARKDNVKQLKEYVWSCMRMLMTEKIDGNTKTFIREQNTVRIVCKKFTND